jgi:hypothetical protein
LGGYFRINPGNLGKIIEFLLLSAEGNSILHFLRHEVVLRFAAVIKDGLELQRESGTDSGFPYQTFRGLVELDDLIIIANNKNGTGNGH